MGRLTGKVAFVTGGARGQGRAIAAKFASEGADIVICDVPDDHGIDAPYELSTSEDLASTVELIESADRRVIAAQVDVRDQEGLNRLAARAAEEFGRIDILSANAGICTMAPAMEMSEPMWQQVLDINLTGVWKSIRSVVPVMQQNNSGSIIITTSINSQEPLGDMTHYVAAKHGALGLMRAFALELGPLGIRVNAVAPGVVGTAMADNDAIRTRIFQRSNATFEEYLNASHNWTALRNTTALNPEAIADAQIWLASDESRFVTGVEIPIDGGHLILPGFNHNPVVGEDYQQLNYKSTALG